VFERSVDRAPVEFTIGEGTLIEGFESAVIGMSPGESKTTTIPADQAYGPHRDELVGDISRDRLPAGMAPQVGDRLEARSSEGPPFTLLVTGVSDEAVTVDANHPLAGQDLTFTIQLVAVL
jgi:peptidylprolyl isomerase